MKAIVVDRWQEPDELQVKTVDEPEVRNGQVLVDVHYAGANFFDILMVQGKYQVRPPFPFIPGSEFSGIITKLGPGVEGFKVGQEVYGTTNLGAYAQKLAVNVNNIRPIPKGMNFIDAAGFMMTYATSYAGLVFRGQVKAGETLLVHAAAGGVGIAAVQIGKALGARVIGTVGSDKKIDVVLKAGADKVINYRQTDFVEAVKELTNGKGADIIYDPVGGDVFDKSMRCVAWGGRVLVVGFAGGRIPSLPTNRLLLKNCSVLGVYWGSYAYNQPERVEEALTALESMYLRGLLKPVTCGVFSLDQLPAALRLIASRDSFGKVIIKINEANRNSSESKL